MSDSHAPCTTTQWTLVLRAATEDSDHGRPAFEQFVQRYWKPLYSFARQRGLSTSDAEDATQEFLSSLLDRSWLIQADPAKGRFRSFLLTTLKQFLIDRYRKEHRQRRGGDMRKWSLDVMAGERTFLMATAHQPDEDRSFMLAWANSILEATRMRLRNEYAGRANLRVHDALSPYLTLPIDQATYLNLSKQLDLSTSALRVALHRLRQRFGESLRDMISETVATPDEVDQELRELLDVLTARAH